VIQQGYFADNGVPGPINLNSGCTKGTTSVTVRADAMNPLCPPPQQSPPPPEPVIFPDRLMLTAFVRDENSKIIGQEHIVVTVKK
jgi:hypothetical protein